jgi:hypothetical protein
MAQPRRATVTLPDLREVEAVEIDVDSASERWSEYILQDGTVIRAKLNLISIWRVEGEYDPQGMPVYQINATPAMGLVSAPEHLKKGGKAS